MRLIVEADGGSRGNPGPAGYGAVVRDASTGRTLAEVAESLGVATNNVAEYRGLIAGLTAAAGLGADAAVEVRMDSKLVVEQMSGRWRIKHPDMKPLALRAQRLAAGFTSVRYTWIPRERNQHADRLANEAMDAAARGRAWRRSADRDDEEPEPPPASESRASGTVRPPASVTESPASGAVRSPASGTAGPAASVTAPPDTDPTTTLLLRHGETTHSADGRLAGLGDIPLTGTGLRQARAVAAALRDRKVDVIVSSPLKRAWQTAEEVAGVLGLQVRVEEDLRETDFGDWDGHTYAEVRERWPDAFDAWLADPGVAPPRGESLTAALRRVRTAKDKLTVRFRRQTVLVVTHVTPIKMLLGLALEAPPISLYRMDVDVASLSIVDWYADGPAVVRAVNDTHHLRPVGAAR